MLCSLVERARKTVRGSADDIGWLQRDQSLPTTEDGTARFLEILDSVRSADVPNSNLILMISKHAFNDSFDMSFISYGPFHPSSEKMNTSYLIHWFTCWFQVSQLVLLLWAVSFQPFMITLYFWLFIGLFSNHGPLYFVKTKAYFSKMGLACHIAKIHSEVLPYTNLNFCFLTLSWQSSALKKNHIAVFSE